MEGSGTMQKKHLQLIVSRDVPVEESDGFITYTEDAILEAVRTKRSHIVHVVGTRIAAPADINGNTLASFFDDLHGLFSAHRGSLTILSMSEIHELLIFGWVTQATPIRVFQGIVNQFRKSLRKHGIIRNPLICPMEGGKSFF